MDIIPYEDRYMGRILEVWNRSLTQDLISRDIFRQKVLADENFTPALAFLAREGEELLGFLLATRRREPYLDRGLEPEKGWIVAMAVAPEHRRQGIGTRLLQAAEAALGEAGARTVILGAYSPHYFMPGVDVHHYAAAVSFFEARGYKAGEAAYAMRRLLFGYEVPQAVLEKEKKALEAGFVFLPYEEKHRRAFGDFLRQNFSAGWQYNAGRLVEEGLARRQIWLCMKGEEVVGYCQRGMDGSASRFGPFGVAEGYRNHSLGSILFCKMLFDMACQGNYLVYFLSTDDPGARFYQRQGMEVYRTFCHCDKAL